MFRYKQNTNGIFLLTLATLSLLLLAWSPMIIAQNQSQNGVRFVAPKLGNDENVDSDESSLITKDDLEDSDDTTTSENDLSEQSQNASQTIPESTLADNQVDREPYDVYKENGQYFVDWEKPDVALVFTGMTNGYIEPCGCAGMDRMRF